MHIVATLRPPRRLRREKEEEALVTKGSIHRRERVSVHVLFAAATELMPPVKGVAGLSKG
jgi:hypothetical protein